MNQSKLERELHMLDDMIETVRKVMETLKNYIYMFFFKIL